MSFLFIQSTKTRPVMVKNLNEDNKKLVDCDNSEKMADFLPIYWF